MCKLEVLTKSLKTMMDCFKIVLQPRTIRFYLQVPLMCCFHLLYTNINVCQIFKITINGIVYEQNRVYKMICVVNHLYLQGLENTQRTILSPNKMSILE